jgi:hypothetical protein
MPNKLSDLEVDEISLVYKGANQHSRVAIAKSLDGQQEETVEIFDQDGNPVDPNALELGDVVFDAQGEAYQFSDDDEDDEAEEYEDQPELTGVGKSAFTAQKQGVAKSATGFADDFRVQLSKALTDSARDEVFAKAVDYVSYLEKIAMGAEEVAKAERDTRRRSEYLEIAKSYSLPVHDNDLADAMMAIEDNVAPEYVEVIAKCLAAASDVMFDELGSKGGGTSSYLIDQIESYANNQVTKSDTSKAELIAKSFADDPSLYDRYLDESGPYNR